MNFAHEGSEKERGLLCGERRQEGGGRGRKGVETQVWEVLYSHEGSKHPYLNLASTQGPEPPKTPNFFCVLALVGP